VGGLAERLFALFPQRLGAPADASGRAGRDDGGMLSTTSAIQHATPPLLAAFAGWFMVRAGVRKRLVSLRAPARCAASGRRRSARPCSCADRR
jgi:hypothetical protein